MFEPSPETAANRAAVTLLAIDTATDRLCVALGAPSGDWLREEDGGAQASARLLPLVRELAREAGLCPGSTADPPVALRGIDAIAFGRGPGAFTGLRTACSVAQGLAWGLGRPVLPIDSLLILAEAAALAGAFGHGLSGAAAASSAPPGPPDPALVQDRDGTVDCWVAVDARMDEVYAAAYRRGPALGPTGRSAGAGAPGLAGASPDWRVLTPPRLYTLPALAALWATRPPQWLLGNAASVFADRLPLQGVLRPQVTGDRAAGLLSLSRAAWLRGEAVDPADALPLYLRDKVALTTVERQVERAAKLATGASAAPGPGATTA